MSAVVFGWVLIREGRYSRTAGVLLIVAFAYGLVLEMLNMFAFETYSYNSDFALRVFGAPLAIGFFWALILVLSMKITDALGVSAWAKPFSDGALCVLVDLAMDVVAIRLEYWTWTLPLDEGFFGVPANNFYSWIFVAICFSTCARFAMQKRRLIWLWLVPGFAYLLLLVLFVAVGVFQALAHIETEQQQFVFFLALLLFCFVCMFFFRRPGAGSILGSYVVG